MKITLETHNKNILFCSDLHFYHKNVINFDKRPYQDIDTMNNSLIENWNNKVSKNDIVFCLGDFSFAKPNKTKDILHSLNGNIIAVVGNHDRYSELVKMDRFTEIHDYIDLHYHDESAIDSNINIQHICLSHYPILIWNRKHHKSFHLHGHCHGALQTNPMYDWYYKGLVMDVGVNCIDYTPISYSEVKEIMLKRVVDVS